LDLGGAAGDGPGRDRTCDLWNKSPLLYQLSYRPASGASVAPRRRICLVAAYPYESEFPSLDLDRPETGILRLTLRTPGRLNAVSEAQHGELARVWQAIGQDEETRAVLVRGADGAFSSGGDLELVLAIADDADTRLRVFHEARDLVYNMLACPTPIVSAITGPAVGAGLVVGLLADVSLASPNARIVDGHTKLG